MRGGLDDALDKLARRDELRRRAAAEATGTPPAINELVEAVAAVVARNPEMAITIGVEGAGEPVLLHFANDGGVVQVNADNAVAARTAEPPASGPRHADFDFDLDPVDDAPGEATRRLNNTPPLREPGYAMPDHEGPSTGDGGRGPGDRTFRYDTPRPYPAGNGYDTAAYDGRPGAHQDRSGGYGVDAAPYAPPQYGATPAAQTPSPRTTPEPLPEPIPLRIDPGESDVAARRLAALLREDPSLLSPKRPD